MNPKPQAKYPHNIDGEPPKMPYNARKGKRHKSIPLKIKRIVEPSRAL